MPRPHFAAFDRAIHAREPIPLAAIPARDPIDRRGDNFRVKFASIKQARSIACESLLESRVAMLLEFASGVVSFTQQAQQLALCGRGRASRYTPDFAVQWRNQRRWLIEVKPGVKTRSPRMEERLQRARNAAAELDLHFVLMTEAEVARPSLQGIERLLEFKQQEHTAHLGMSPSELAHLAEARSRDLNALKQSMGESTCIRRSHADSVLNEHGDGEHRVTALLADRALVWNVDHMLLPSTLIHLYSESNDEALFLPNRIRSVS